MDFKVLDLGVIDFKKAWGLQKDIFAQVKNLEFNSALIFCQHLPVITLGRSADRKNILAGDEDLKRLGIALYEVERGGDVTYHGPGQLTVYPVFNLNYLKKDIHWFLRKLEEVILDLLSDFTIKAKRRLGLTGVWVKDQKIASIGIAIKNWITFHGMSINIKAADLVNFQFIRPCGMDIKMISLEDVLGREIEIERIKENLIQKFINLGR